MGLRSHDAVVREIHPLSDHGFVVPASVLQVERSDERKIVAAHPDAATPVRATTD